MKKMIRISTLFAAILVLGISSAHAAKVSLLGGVNLPQMTGATAEASGLTVVSSYAMSYQGGLLIEFPFSSVVGLELGALFHSTSISSTTSGEISGIPVNQSLSLSSNDIQMPLMFQFWMGRHFALGVGGFFSLGLGESAGSNYGIVGGARISLGGGSTRFIVDGRYNYGLVADSSGVKFSEVVVMAGVTFGASK